MTSDVPQGNGLPEWFHHQAAIQNHVEHALEPDAGYPCHEDTTLMAAHFYHAMTDETKRRNGTEKPWQTLSQAMLAVTGYAVGGKSTTAHQVTRETRLLEMANTPDSSPSQPCWYRSWRHRRWNSCTTNGNGANCCTGQPMITRRQLPRITRPHVAYPAEVLGIFTLRRVLSPAGTIYPSRELPCQRHRKTLASLRGHAQVVHDSIRRSPPEAFHTIPQSTSNFRPRQRVNHIMTIYREQGEAGDIRGNYCKHSHRTPKDAAK